MLLETLEAKLDAENISLTFERGSCWEGCPWLLFKIARTVASDST